MSDTPTWPSVLGQLLRRCDLSREQAGWGMEQIMTGQASPAQIAAFAVALRCKGESVAELSGLVDTMLAHAEPLTVPGPIVDVVGTGGDGHCSVNVSTMAALVVAGAGVRVVKHGNRAASSRSGSADVLEQLGVRLDLPPQRVAEVAVEAGITFCFARTFHPAMRHAAGVRSEIGVPTAFNVLGPLTNPARPRAAAVGCADERMAPVMAGVLAARGDSALVFRGRDGLDELTTTAGNDVWQVHDGQVSRQELDSAQLQLPAADLGQLRGGDAQENARVVRQVLAGEPGPVRDVVLLNAAAALVAARRLEAGHELDLVADLRTALADAASAIDSGAAAGVLARWVDVTQH